MELTDYNEMRLLLERHGFHFSKSMGQNFLTAEWVPRQLADSALLDKNTGVLEVGPGIGCLTAELSKRAGKVLSVELDKALKGVLAETLAGYDNVELIFADILKQNIPALLQEHFGDMPCAVCANLPYNVTTPLLTAFIQAERIDTIAVMVQREVAERICAAPGTENYGAFGIYALWHMEAEALFDVPPNCFMPRPKVTSSILRLTRRKVKPVEVMDEVLLFRVIRAAFNQRRKTLVNALASAFGEVEKAQLAEIVGKCGFDTRIRGEMLDIGGFAKISDEIYRIIKGIL